jgi:uncharacterized protein (DUF1684 family)
MEEGRMSQQDAAPATWLDLYDWRQRVAHLYAEREAALRVGEEPLLVLRRFRAAKDALFKRHPQSPLAFDARARFGGLSYFPYDPMFQVEAELAPVAPDAHEQVTLPASGPDPMPMRRAALLRCTLVGTPVELTVYWVDVYGGGLFLPFRDATTGHETYGAGRYLFDTVKGSDFLRFDARDDDPELGKPLTMGYPGGRVLVDFNYAYNPSCAYDARWLCPLSPPENTLSIAVPAGERTWQHGA